MKKYVFLDIDNTLLDFNKSSKISIVEGFRRYGLKYSENIFDTFVLINDELWERVEKKEISKEQLYNIRWQKIFNELQIDFNGHRFEKYFLESLHEIAEEVEGATNLLEYLSRRYDVSLTSNAPYHQQLNRLKKADMLRFVNRIYVSEKIGYPKPHKEFFDYCLKDLEITDKKEVIIIGDSYTSDIQGGINSHIDTIWFDRTNVQKQDLQYNYRVHSLNDIFAIL